ncbi:MAG: hypothetical protein D3925_00125 [Candidatus Electrothrix sp. AR5]|nr:hypothetical protein [Candidatus Electrothrix sp. AR5]
MTLNNFNTLPFYIIIFSSTFGFAQDNTSADIPSESRLEQKVEILSSDTFSGLQMEHELDLSRIKDKVNQVPPDAPNDIVNDYYDDLPGPDLEQKADVLSDNTFSDLKMEYELDIPDLIPDELKNRKINDEEKLAIKNDLEKNAQLFGVDQTNIRDMEAVENLIKQAQPACINNSSSCGGIVQDLLSSQLPDNFNSNMQRDTTDDQSSELEQDIDIASNDNPSELRLEKFKEKSDVQRDTTDNQLSGLEQNIDAVSNNNSSESRLGQFEEEKPDPLVDNIYKIMSTPVKNKMISDTITKFTPKALGTPLNAVAKNIITFKNIPSNIEHFKSSNSSERIQGAAGLYGDAMGWNPITTDIKNVLPFFIDWSSVKMVPNPTLPFDTTPLPTPKNDFELPPYFSPSKQK